MPKIPLGFIEKREKGFFVYLGAWRPVGKFRIFNSKTLKIVVSDLMVLVYYVDNGLPKFIEAIIDHKKFIPGKQTYALITTSKKTLRHQADGTKRRTLYYNSIFISDLYYLNLNIPEKVETVLGTLEEPYVLAGKHLYLVTIPLRVLKKDHNRDISPYMEAQEQYCQTWLF